MPGDFALAWARAHPFAEALVVDLFVVSTHQRYASQSRRPYFLISFDTMRLFLFQHGARVRSVGRGCGRLDVSGVREGLFAMAEPLDQELSFTVLVPLHLSRFLYFSFFYYYYFLITFINK